MFTVKKDTAIVLKQQFKDTRTKQKEYAFNRGRAAKRLVEIMIALGTKQYTKHELARKFKMSPKTIMRDLKIIEEIGAPLIVEGNYYDDMEEDNYKASVRRCTYRIERYWMRRFI